MADKCRESDFWERNTHVRQPGSAMAALFAIWLDDAWLRSVRRLTLQLMPCFCCCQILRQDR